VPDSPPIGCTLPSSGAAADPSMLGALAQTAEAVGFDSVWISDHVVVPEHIESAYPYSADGRFPTLPTQPYLEPLTTLGYLAGITRRVRLGIAVLILPYRHPLLTAKMVATLDTLSAGRIDLGIGVGWMREEFEALGAPPEVYTHRGSASDEQLRIFDTVWTQDVAGYEGKFYRFAPVGVHPRPVQKPGPPIWIGGHTGPALRRVAHHGDGWLPIVRRSPADLPPDEFATCMDTIHTEAQRVGRDPARLRVCVSITLDLDATSPEEVAALLRSYTAVGAQSFLLGFGRRAPGEFEASLRRFAEDFRPALVA
jgi:probable F420-dependent oxidoreductase